MPLIYRVRDEVGSTYFRTRADAHSAAKALKHLDPDIELLDVPADAASICAYLNGVPPAAEPKQRWVLSPRGGLVEQT